MPDYPGAGTLSEAHVFIQDPQQTWDDLFKIKMSGNPSRAFSRLVSGRAGAIGIVWPRWHGLTAPGGSRSSAHLNCLQFYPSVGADTGTRVGCTVHHVEALRVNDRGGCATKTEMPAREFAQDLWCTFKDKADTDFSSVVRHANKVASFLTHEPGTAATNARGGFASYIDFAVGETFGAERFYMWYAYRFTLDNGILALGHLGSNAYVMRSGVLFKDPYNELVMALTGTGKDDAHAQFEKSAQLSQAVPIPGLDGNNVRCTPSSRPENVYEECGVAVNTLLLGLANAHKQGLISGGANGEQAQLVNVVTDATNWTCQAYDPGYYDPHNCIGYNETPPKPVCRLQLRAKRLNVYPDSVELVWFNGDQRPMTTAFALAKVLQGQWLKSQDPKDLESLQQLCMPSPVGPGTAGSGPPDYYRESYIYDPDL